MTIQPRSTREPKWTKRQRRIALITIIDYLSHTDRPVTCSKLFYVLAERGITINMRTLQRWLKRWSEDNRYTTIKIGDSAPGKPYTYTVDKCEDNRSYQQIIRLVDWYIRR